MSTAPTLRTLSGAVRTTHLQATTTAIIVIDIQNEYFPGGKLPVPDGQRVLEKNQQLLNFARSHTMPIFFVQHLGSPDGPLFAEGSGFDDFHAKLQPYTGDRVIRKATPSAFVGTDLEAQLNALGIKQLIVSGLMTHMCVSSTARDAVPKGFSVIIPDDACATRDVDGWDGNVLSHQQLHYAALTAVGDVFAEVMSTTQLTALPVY